MQAYINQTTDNHPKVITASVLEVLAKDQDGEVSAIGQSRLKYFTELAQTTGETEFRDAIRDYRKAHEAEESGKKVASVRAAEFQALFFGIKNNASYADMGYNAAIKHARLHLEACGLRTNGKPLLSDEEKEANRDKNDRAKAAAEASKQVDMNKPGFGAALEEATVRQLAAIQAEREAKILAARIEKADALVASIVESGEEYATLIFMKLAEALGYDMQDEEQIEEQAAMEAERKAA